MSLKTFATSQYRDPVLKVRRFMFDDIDKTIGLRVTEVEEDIGLDIAQHAERAYVEQ